ncbi:MAG: polyprenyl synthetase family protein [Oscillospiraceae bacterium]|nr:polyprenyl synthetase family protein [Oscillospiraceae bacterium]
MDGKLFDARFGEYTAAVEAYLSGLFEEKAAERLPWGRLYESMSYSVMSGGKRIRPMLTLECARLGGIRDWRTALPFACALELVHTYSLIHDDLPCMDDDELRRGKPTNHVVFGETMATLAGDALQAEAYRLIARASELTDAAKVDAVLALSRASGADGMVAGQVLDLTGYGHDRETLTTLCDKKTGFMLKAAAELGCAAAGAPEELRGALAEYASRLGLAFQIRDDLLDVTGDEKTFGKPIGSDREEGKITFVDVLGVDGCAREVSRLTEEAVAALDGVEGGDFLIHLAHRLSERDR